MNRERALQLVLMVVGVIFLVGGVSADDVLMAERLAVAAASAGI